VRNNLLQWCLRVTKTSRTIRHVDIEQLIDFGESLSARTLGEFHPYPTLYWIRWNCLPVDDHQSILHHELPGCFTT
jgi:hypothetical protein